MSEFITIMIWIGFLALITNSQQFWKEEFVAGEYAYRMRWIVAILAFAPIVWMAAHRSNGFSDTFVYRSMFYSIPRDFEGAMEFVKLRSKDKGFYAFSALLRLILPDDKVPYFYVIAGIQAISLARFFRKYSERFIFCVFLFLASADYITWMFNGIRQFTAVAIILFATPYILEKKLFRAILIVLLASTFHQSALIMIPIIFIVQGDAWNSRTMLFLGLVVLAISFVGGFTDFLDSALEGTQYVNIVSDYTEAGDDGTNYIRAFIYCIPAIISFVNRRRIQSADNTLINICTNMSIISAGLYVVSTATSGIFIGRLPIYCSLYSYVLLDWEICYLYEGENRRTISTVSILGYLAFYYVQLHYFWGLI